MHQAENSVFSSWLTGKSIQVDDPKGFLGIAAPVSVYVQYILRVANFLGGKPE
jgi:hypothetical protein